MKKDLPDTTAPDPQQLELVTATTPTEPEVDVRPHARSRPKRTRRTAPPTDESTRFMEIGRTIGQLVDQKNRAYGDSFAKTGSFLALLYPNGIRPEQYGDMLTLVKIFDKQIRIATDLDAFDESPFAGIAGYGILGVANHNRREAIKMGE